MFSGCQIALELDSSLPFKKKKAVKRDVIDNGGVVSFIVTKKVRDVLESPLLLLLNVSFFCRRSSQVTHLVVNDVEKAKDSYKSRMAAKWGIPVVSLDFIDACLEAGTLLEPDKFIVVGKTASEQLSSGKIVGR